MRKLGSVLAGVILLTASISAPAMGAAPALLTGTPVTILEAVDNNGQPATNVVVTVRAVTGSGGMVFQGRTDKQGRVRFSSNAPADVLSAAPGQVADMVYEVFFTAPGGVVHTSTFSVPHVKNASGVSSQERLALESERVKNVSVRLNTNAVARPNLSAEEATAAPMESNCTNLGNG